MTVPGGKKLTVKRVPVFGGHLCRNKPAADFYDIDKTGSRRWWNILNHAEKCL